MDIIKLIYTHHRQAFLQMFALTLLSGALGIGTLSYINHYLLQDNQLHGGLGGFVLLLLFYFVAASVAQIQLARIGQNFIYQTQTQFVKRIMDSHDAQIQHIGKAKILASLSSDVRSLSFAFTRLPELVQGALFTLACSLYLMILSFKLFVVVAILMTAMIAGTHFVVKRHYSSFRQMRHAEDDIQSHYETTLNGHKELKLNRFRAERFYRETFLPQAQMRRDAHIQADSYHAIAINWGNSVMLGAVGVIFYLSMQYHWASLSDAATITMIVLFMRAPLTAAIGALPAIMQSQVGLQALKNLGLVDYQPHFHSDFRLPENWQRIRLQQITYAYPVQGGQHFSLQPIDLTIERGETLFLIGGNGSGKSTLSLVLSGLYTPTSGKIFVDDIEITEENREAYRQLFASVFTDFHIFEQLMDGMGNDVADEQISAWLNHLQLSDKVKIEQKRILNSKLSQGQRKRLALMIAALEQRSIMILDEWAADQDPQFRRVFYENLLPLLKNQGYTVFAISHDDKYFHHAQRIVSMKNGVLQQLDSESAKNVADENSRAA
ncbi:multidrug ABC transporter permease/ATP-binding protein [Alysiella filiformis]|uniref:Putative ATP-binding cassette transporter n=1 Tax=Alysiella filiformis DSM 16848 TaxID=1120981 RepID=A0A286E7K2_9NEIS|nr:multidrug ABC transporter permease/ATP-binding protein [Alysiella filiformis]QMT31606.1 multidrug ABC transporter permease/ATP-binding protein [Alysiella filiformis]UBQ55383.1 multidrug ABC transporter permease/ATP-binding protein [Alysiella filiformis DSM 16848]SOD66834.1 putative ATP-binding cassette transporter [Alysiella filiformis DSM 16848]